MPHDCSQHHHKKADTWTNIGTLGEGVSSFISDAYWFAGIFDLVSGLETAVIGLSYYALVFGSVLALLSAGGAAYAHRALNTFHQSDSTSTSQQSTTPPNEQVSLLNAAQVTVPSSDSTSHKKSALTWLQILALSGDFLSHTGDISGPLTFVVSLAAGNNLSRLQKIYVQIPATFIGAISNVANIRTCINVLKAKNQEGINTDPHQEEASHANNHGHSHDDHSHCHGHSH